MNTVGSFLEIPVIALFLINTFKLSAIWDTLISTSPLLGLRISNKSNDDVEETD